MRRSNAPQGQNWITEMTIAQITAKLRYDSDNPELLHRLAEARLERSIELGIQVSVEDADLLHSYTWRESNNGNYIITSIECPAGKGNTGVKKLRYSTTLNRLVMSRILGVPVWDIPTDIHSDHIDESRGKADCRRDNIQPLTAEENSKKARTCRVCGTAYGEAA